MRFICVEIENIQFGLIVVVGMEVIILLVGRRVVDEWVYDNIMVLFVVVYFYVMMWVKVFILGVEVNSEMYVFLRKEIFELLERVRDEVDIKVVDEDLVWFGWFVIKFKVFDEVVVKVKERGWFDSDWYRGIVDIVKFDGMGDMQMGDDEDVGLVQMG